MSASIAPASSISIAAPPAVGSPARPPPIHPTRHRPCAPAAGHILPRHPQFRATHSDPAERIAGVGARDPRRPADARQAPFAALGRLQTEIGGRCTGTLITPTEVLTAAHCLLAGRTGSYVQPSSIHFLQGYANGQFTAHGRGARIRIGPGYDPATSQPAAADWAIVTLLAPIAGPLLPLWRGELPPRTPLILAGYQQDRPELLMADTACRVLGIQSATLVHDCAGTRGASGAPLLAQQGGLWVVAGISSRVSRDLAIGQAVLAQAVIGR